MKKYISLLGVGLLSLAVFSPAFAQNVNTSSIESTRQALIQVLTQLLQQLEAELQTLLAQQGNTNGKTGGVSSSCTSVPSTTGEGLTYPLTITSPQTDSNLTPSSFQTVQWNNTNCSPNVNLIAVLSETGGGAGQWNISSNQSGVSSSQGSINVNLNSAQYIGLTGKFTLTTLTSGTYRLSLKRADDTQAVVGPGVYVNVAVSGSTQNQTSECSSAVSPYTLTDCDILGATYSISPNLMNGTTIPPQKIIFPKHTDSNNILTNPIYFTSNGQVTTNVVNFVEAFWIYSYNYTDSSRTEAKVYINGNYGASGNDGRAFNVLKVNGVVTTKETSCPKASNGSCLVNN